MIRGGVVGKTSPETQPLSVAGEFGRVTLKAFRNATSSPCRVKPSTMFVRASIGTERRGGSRTIQSIGASPGTSDSSLMSIRDGLYTTHRTDASERRLSGVFTSASEFDVAWQPTHRLRGNSRPSNRSRKSLNRRTVHGLLAIASSIQSTSVSEYVSSRGSMPGESSTRRSGPRPFRGRGVRPN